MKKGVGVKLSDSQRIDFLRRLREARSLVLRDAESFHRAVATLEHIGQYVDPNRESIGGGLSDYKNEILNLATQSGPENWSNVEKLFETVRIARNDAVHGGDYIRHQTSRLNELFLILEQSIMAELRLAGDIMVRDPVVAQHWHSIGDVRRSMLANSFSHLPLQLHGEWKVVSDFGIARFLTNLNRDERDQRLIQKISNVGEDLQLSESISCSINDEVPKLVAAIDGEPTKPAIVLVFENDDDPKDLLGIITPFDLL